MSAAPDTSGSKNSIQALGSAQTYLQRYTLYAILGLASGDADNDGNSEKHYITEEQAVDLQSIVEEVGGNAGMLLKGLKAKTFAAILERDYGKALRMIKQKRAKK